MAIIVSECPGEFRSSKLGKVATNKKGQVTLRSKCFCPLSCCEVLSSLLFSYLLSSPLSFFSPLFCCFRFFSSVLFSPHFFSFLHSSIYFSSCPLSCPVQSSHLLFVIPHPQITIDTLANLRLRLNVTKDRYRMSQVNHSEECEISVY